MNASIEPAVPLLATILGYALFALWVALLAVAVTTLVRADRLTAAARAAWCLAMIVVPLIGCIAWLIYYSITRNALRPSGSP